MKKNKILTICLALVLCISLGAAGCGKSSDKKASSKGSAETEKGNKEQKEGDLGTGEDVLVLEENASESVSSDIEELEKEQIVEGSVMDDDVQFIEDEEYEKQNSSKGS